LLKTHPQSAILKPTAGESLTKAKDNVVAAVHTSTAPPAPTAGDQLKEAASKVRYETSLNVSAKH